MERFEDRWERCVREVVCQDGEERIADEGQIGQEVGLARTRLVFAQQNVASPVIADFDSTPVSADEFQPLLGPILLGRGTRQVIARLDRRVPGLFERALAAQDDQGPGVREVGRERFDGEGVQVADFDPAVSRLGLGKKGVPGRASRPRACLSRLGWLPLIWTR